MRRKWLKSGCNMSRPNCWREISAFALATTIGALWDEHLTAGLTTFVSMCRTTDPGLLALLMSFATLLPVATLATLAVSASLLLVDTALMFAAVYVLGGMYRRASLEERAPGRS
jgi:hypothetical protein